MAVQVQPAGTLGATAPGAGRAAIHIVDDDPAVRKAITRLLSLEPWEVHAYDSAESFLAAAGQIDTGCVILDFALPGQDGVALQLAMAQRGVQLPVIFLTGHADVPLTVSAMKQGALDFLVKPVDVTRAARRDRLAPCTRDDRLRAAARHREVTESRMASLDAPGARVLLHVMEGRLDKQIAADLGAAEKTIKVHRARGMEKMHVRSVADLVRIVERAHPQRRGRGLAA